MRTTNIAHCGIPTILAELLCAGLATRNGTLICRFDFAYLPQHMVRERQPVGVKEHTTHKGSLGSGSGG